MNRILFLYVALSSGLAAAAPQIVGFASVQSNRNTKVTTTFTLSGEAILTADVRTNGVSIGWRNFRAGMSGAALNRVNPAGAYTLEWDPSATWDAPMRKLPGGMVTLEVTAWSPDNPPDYMDIDLTSNSNVAYYVSSDDLPLAVTDTVYKTTHLLMRRIHAANKTWLMGSPASEGGRSTVSFLETQHPVCLSSDYYLGVFELTQGQYENFGLTVPDGQSSVGPCYPLAMISHQALHGWWNYWWPENGHTVNSATDQNGLYTMRRKTGIQFDLPLEAQWEYACRAGTTSAYIGGTASGASVQTYAVYSANAPTNADGAAVCAEVGTKLPNAFGLYDMIGNVSEICLEQATYNPGATYVCDPYGKVVSKDSESVHFANRGSNYSQPWSKWSDIFKATIQYHRAAYRGDYYNTKPSSAVATRGVRLAAPVAREWPTVKVASGTVAQDSSRRVAITYEQKEESIVTLELYEDGQRVSDEALRAVCGDVNRVVSTGATKVVYWTPDASWEGRTRTAGKLSFKLRTWATNDPPAYMALDLRSKDVTNISFYASAEAMPEPITNDLWKTDYLVMRRIPAKDVTWWMGIATNAAGESAEGVGYDPARAPRHRVRLSQDYYMAVFELTQRQARLFESTKSAEANRSNWTLPYSGKYLTMRYMGAGGDDWYAWPTKGHQVRSDSGLAKFRERLGLQFDYPTEAQWEYACRAGSDHRYQDMSIGDCAWYVDNATAMQSVGGKKPNAWGLYDMLGNAYEYCVDSHSWKYGLTDAQLASETPVVDPYGASAESAYKTMRGGAWKNEDFECRTGERNNNHYNSDWGCTGFRLVCPVPGETFADPVLSE